MLRHPKKNISSIAKDRAWFIDYRPFKSFVQNHRHKNGCKPFVREVFGLGTVEIPIKTNLKGSGPKAHAKLRLTNVLHVPDHPCNILSGRDYELSTEYRGDYALMQLTESETGKKQKGYLVRFDSTFWQVKLSGAPHGPRRSKAPFVSNTLHHAQLSAHWPHEEQVRWAKYMAFQEWLCEMKGRDYWMTAITKTYEPYTRAEKKWLVKNTGGGEAKFLARLGLDVQKWEDKRAGRASVRIYMHQERHGVIAESRAKLLDAPEPWFLLDKNLRTDGLDPLNVYVLLETDRITDTWGGEAELLRYMRRNTWDMKEMVGKIEKGLEDGQEDREEEMEGLPEGKGEKETEDKPEEKGEKEMEDREEEEKRGVCYRMFRGRLIKYDPEDRWSWLLTEEFPRASDCDHDSLLL